VVIWEDKRITCMMTKKKLIRFGGTSKCIPAAKILAAPML